MSLDDLFRLWSIEEQKPTEPGRCYFVTIYPADPLVMDQGMTLKILVRADNPRQARRRVRRYAPGRIQAVQLVRWTAWAVSA